MDTFQRIQQLAEEVAEGKISMAEAILSLPEDFSECKGKVVELPRGSYETSEIE